MASPTFAPQPESVKIKVPLGIAEHPEQLVNGELGRLRELLHKKEVTGASVEVTPEPLGFGSKTVYLNVTYPRPEGILKAMRHKRVVNAAIKEVFPDLSPML
jgi:hypothetical protein